MKKQREVMKKSERNSRNRNSPKLKALALSEVFMFILSSFAFSFILGGMFVGSLGEVSGVSELQLTNAKVGDKRLYNGVELVKQDDGMWKSTGPIVSGSNTIAAGSKWTDADILSNKDITASTAILMSGSGTSSSAQTKLQTGATATTTPSPTPSTATAPVNSGRVVGTSFSGVTTVKYEINGKEVYQDYNDVGTPINNPYEKQTKVVNGKTTETKTALDPAKDAATITAMENVIPYSANAKDLAQVGWTPLDGEVALGGTTYNQDGSVVKNALGIKNYDATVMTINRNGVDYYQVNGKVYSKDASGVKELDDAAKKSLGLDKAAVVSAAAGNDLYGSGKFGGIFGEHQMSNVWGNLYQGVSWAVAVGGIMTFLGQILPKDQQEFVQPLGLALSAGIFAGKGAMSLSSTKFGSNFMGSLEDKFGGSAEGWATGTSLGVGILVTYLVFASQYEKTKKKEETIEFKCMNWQAPHGGSDCNECNKNPFQPCSEYRCKSLGQTCKLINSGTAFERCIDSSPNDVTSPGIKIWKDKLTLGYQYKDVKERPPGGEGPAGMKITDPENKDGCLKPFTPFEFGIITTDKGSSEGGATVTQPAQCKIDFNHTLNFEEMGYWMGEDNLFVENHSQGMSLPGADLINSLYADEENRTTLPIKNDGEYTLYIRCKDGNGNENRDEFSVSFCIDKSPDATAPTIESTSIPTNSPVSYKVDNLSIEVYTNEPANCKWSRKDTDYKNMENNMTCNNEIWEMNAQLFYTCDAKLTGVKDKEENNFYFRCEDRSVRKNTMQQSYNMLLIGTQPLDIVEVTPNGTIGSSTTTATVDLIVKTDNGFKDGEARCSYSTSENSGFIEMFETGTSISKQSLDLIGGDYKYYFSCIDSGGNIAKNSTSFNVFVDKFSPMVVRAYKYESKILIITDEESACSYSTTSCNFDLSKNEGTVMPYDFDASKAHATSDWKIDQTYYIKCKDKYNNQPSPSECSIVIRPFELSKE